MVVPILRISVKTSYPMWLAVFFLAAVFLMGGGARSDIQSLVILRPLAAICMGVALWGLSRDAAASVRVPLLLALIIPLIMVFQLIPLPPAIWTSLPGRDFYAEAAPLAGIEQPWRPISLVPYRTWNSLLAWLVPITMVLLAARLGREQRYNLLPALIAMGLFSGIVGLAQIVGSANGPLYLYRITNNGSAVGLFANRNHQAALLACLFPMLAVYASIKSRSLERARMKSALCACIALFIVPLILVTGSRAGLALGLVGLLSAALLYRSPYPRQRKGLSRFHRFKLRYVIGALAVVCLGAATALLSRARVFDRLLTEDETEDLRLQVLDPIWQMIQTYFPFGIGFGAFPDVYKVHEPFELLATTYVNHAHNDLLEFILEGGLLAVAALFIGVAAWLFRVWRLHSAEREDGRAILFARLGSAVTLLLALASLVDYPLRVPSLSAVFAIAVIWMAFGAGSSNTRRGGDETRDTTGHADAD